MNKNVNFFQSCVGVMLVGPTGGGKTTVRKILERALMLLPVVDMLSIKQSESPSKVNVPLNKMFPHIFIFST